MEKYLIITECGEINSFSGELTQEIIEAVDHGVYSVIDITNPDKPMDKKSQIDGWGEIKPLPKFEEE